MPANTETSNTETSDTLGSVEQGYTEVDIEGIRQTVEYYRSIFGRNSGYVYRFKGIFRANDNFFERITLDFCKEAKNYQLSTTVVDLPSGPVIYSPIMINNSDSFDLVCSLQDLP